MIRSKLKKNKLSYRICIAYFFVGHYVGHISEDCAMSRWLVGDLSPQSPGFKPRLAGVGFVVDGVAF